MAGSAYASALGRLKPDFSTFLSKETYPTLLGAKDVSELAKLLEPVGYGDALARERATREGGPLIEAAVNRMLVLRNRRAFEATPFAGRLAIGAYLGRWDVQNVELILAAKAYGRSIAETEVELVSSREIPAGLYAGVLTLDDVRTVVAQPTLEATVAALTKFGYGTTILPLLEAFQRSHDIFPIFHALDAQYYRGTLAATRFFQGDEWVFRQFLAEEIDARNTLLLLKGRAHGLSLDEITARWLEGGTLGLPAAADLYTARSVPELVERLRPRSPSLPEGNDAYAASQSLTVYEAALQRDRAVTELRRMRAYPLSISVIVAYLLRAEFERADLRRIAFGRMYGLPNERIEPLLLSPRL
jgi:vacuolar-type H+-ATPase subunit C/Vma6